MLALTAGTLVAASPSLRDTAVKTNDAADAIATILWVDDNPSNNREEVAYLKDRKVAVHLVENTADALKLLRMNDYRLVVSDLGRGEDRLAGLRLIAAMKQEGRDLPVLIYTVRAPGRGGHNAQKQTVTDAGARGLAVTPAEVQSSVLDLVGKQASPSAKS